MSSEGTAVLIDSSALSRGSLWRKWDLHVHTPLSALNNQFPQLPGDQGPDWERFIQRLEACGDVAAFCITDYFTIDGYKKILTFREQGRIANIPLILPGIEFRLDKLVGSPGRRLNMHVIFSNEVSPDIIEEHFLRNISLYVEGRPQTPDEVWRISHAQLEQLGQRLKEQHAPFRNRNDFEIGCMNATVKPEEIKRILDERPSIFKDRYLVVFAEDSSGLMSWDGQDHLTRKLLLQGSDALYSSNPNTRKWALGQLAGSPENFRAEFKTLKPCIHGSDAHALDKVAEPDGHRYCWIKADPTFQGLRQILYEPEERVFIGEQPPKLKSDYQLIDRIQVQSCGTWFDPIEIPLNGDLVAIIGGRGSGKSALAELLAFAGGSDTFKTARDIEDCFLYKASNKSAANPVPVTGAQISIYWQDGKTSSSTVSEELEHGLDEELVKYLPQKFVERLCAPENTLHLQEEIERIIFQSLEPGLRLDASNFIDLRERLMRAINLKKQNLREAIHTINTSITDLVSKIAERQAKQTMLKQKEAELVSLLKQPPELPGEDQGSLRQLEDLAKRKQNLEKQTARFRDQLATIEEIDTRVALFEQQVKSFNSDLELMLQAVGLESEKDKFLVSVPVQAHTILAKRQAVLKESITEVQNGSVARPQEESLKRLGEQIEELKSRLQSTESKRREYEKFQADKNQLEEIISGLQKDIKEIDEILKPRFENEKKTRLDKYLEFFDVLKEEKQQLEQLYRPLHEALEHADEIAQKLGFISKATYQVTSQAERAEQILDQRKMRYREDTMEDTLKNFFKQVEETQFEKSALKDVITNLYRSFEPLGLGVSEIIDQLRKGRTLREFDDWIFATECFAVSYDLTYDGKDLQLLSPGERGIVLLLLYLEAEKTDNRPLIIDQPDDNLDNLSVYPSLIDYFRERKNTRQIIIITHNPNLVVNTDAEQVIVANYDGSRNPRIRYRSGGLENTHAGDVDGIREDVCKILEGGTEAFRRREQKYSLPPM